MPSAYPARLVNVDLTNFQRNVPTSPVIYNEFDDAFATMGNTRLSIYTMDTQFVIIKKKKKGKEKEEIRGRKTEEKRRKEGGKKNEGGGRKKKYEGLKRRVKKGATEV